jgi:hypothetical protein
MFKAKRRIQPPTDPAISLESTLAQIDKECIAPFDVVVNISHRMLLFGQIQRMSEIVPNIDN